MRNKSIRYLVNFVAVLALLSYFVALIVLGRAEYRKELPENAIKIISGILTGVGGVLGTFFGAAVGLQQIGAPDSGTPVNPPATPDPIPHLTTFQVVAAWGYLISLLLALILWAVTKFDSETPEAVSSLALTFPGVAIGILTVTLAFKPNNGGNGNGGNGA